MYKIIHVEETSESKNNKNDLPSMDQNLPARAMRIRNKNYLKRLKANRKNNNLGGWLRKKLKR